MNLERRSEISNLIGDIKPRKSNGNTNSSGSSSVVTQGSIVVHGNLTLNDTKYPQRDSFNQVQIQRIQQLIYNLADLDIACGYTSTGEMNARRKWWYILRTHFEVSSYKLIPVEKFDEVILFLTNHLRKLQNKAAETSNSKWRNKYYSAIYAKCKETGLSKEQLYEMIDQYLNVTVTSLTDLTGSQLKHLYNIITD